MLLVSCKLVRHIAHRADEDPVVKMSRIAQDPTSLPVLCTKDKTGEDGLFPSGLLLFRRRRESLVKCASKRSNEALMHHCIGLT